MPKQAPWPAAPQPPPVDWDALIAEVLAAGADVPEVAWAVPGETAATEARPLVGMHMQTSWALRYAFPRAEPGETAAMEARPLAGAQMQPSWVLRYAFPKDKCIAEQTGEAATCGGGSGWRKDTCS